MHQDLQRIYRDLDSITQMALAEKLVPEIFVLLTPLMQQLEKDILAANFDNTDEVAARELALLYAKYEVIRSFVDFFGRIYKAKQDAVVRDSNQ